MSRQKLSSLFAIGLATSMLLILSMVASACSKSSTTSPTAIQVNLVSESNPAAPGVPVTFFATVSVKNGSSTPTGTVTFNDGSTTLGTVTLDQNGLAIYTAPSLSAGTHDIIVSYSGDTQFRPGTSAPMAQTVGQVLNTPVATTTGAAAPVVPTTTTAAPIIVITVPAVVAPSGGGD